MVATQEMIAKRVGVSQITVSQILSRVPNARINKKTREEVIRVANKLDYHPNIIARGLVTRKTRSIGVATHSIEYLTEMYFGTIMQGIAHQVGLHNYNMQFEVTDCSGESTKNLYFIKSVKEKSVDGIIVIDQVVSDLEIIKLKEMNIPFVLVDRYLPDLDVYCVRVDNKKGIYIATENLIKNGHKRIAFVNEYMKFNKIIDMFKGYCQALEENGISIDNELIIDTSGGNIHSALTEVRRVEYLLRLNSPPTAILCSCDLLAVQVLRILKEMEPTRPS